MKPVTMPEASSSWRPPESVREAAAELEGVFMQELMKVMRRTVPKSGLTGGGFGAETYLGMLDEALTREAAAGGGLGLADAIAEQLGASKSDVPAWVDRLLRRPGWVRPLGAAPVDPHGGQRFGAEREGLRPDDCGDGHCGVDFGVPVGTPVGAASAGVVTHVERDAGGAGGRWVGLAHGRGETTTRYFHLDQVREDLEVGDPVGAGELLGWSGDTGTASEGAHLHFELRYRDAHNRTRWLDPEPYLKAWPGGEVSAAGGPQDLAQSADAGPSPVARSGHQGPGVR